MALPRAVVYCGLLALAGGLYFWSSDEPQPKDVANKPLATATNRTTRSSSAFLQADYNAHFEKPKVNARDLFLPAFKAPLATAQLPKPEDLVQIPPGLAKGDANWRFTGVATVNGTRMALLENNSSHQSGFVKEGESWLTCTVKRITPESLVLVDQDGIEQVVMRFNANATQKPPPVPESGLKPLDLGPTLNGEIGRNIQIQPTSKDTSKTP